jgi:hypothetical protein
MEVFEFVHGSPNFYTGFIHKHTMWYILCLDPPDGNSGKKGLGLAKQELGTFGHQNIQAVPSQERPHPNPPRGQGQRAVHPPRWPENQKGPGTYTEALTTTKMAIFKELYPEDKLNEADQQSTLDVLGEVLHRTPVEELPHLKSYRLEGGALIYICVDQQSSQWLSKAINNHRLETGTRLKVTEARNLPKPVKVALRVRGNVAQTHDELLHWVKSLNPGLNTEH